jgi:MYXO-CTERM domain-containing protein
VARAAGRAALAAVRKTPPGTPVAAGDGGLPAASDDGGASVVGKKAGSSGCSCTVGERGRPAAPALFVILGLVVLRRRRHQ